MQRSGQVVIGTKWEAVGPFPSGMREHPLTASPLAAFVDGPVVDPDVNFARKPYDEEETWPSELPTGGRVGWRRFEAGDDGWLEVSFPDVRWAQLRSDHGWAALQCQTILRTSLTVPRLPHQSVTPIRIDLVQGVEFALISSDADPQAPTRWYNGDIYAFADTSTGSHDISCRTSNFARSLAIKPGEYALLVRAIYEVRMFGDPGPSLAPVIRLRITAEVDNEAEATALLPGTGIIPDALDGWLMGEWISVGMRVPDGGEAVIISEVECDLGSSVQVQLGKSVRIVPGQTRPVALRVTQRQALKGCVTSLSIRFTTAGKSKTVLTWHPNVKQHYTGDTNPIRITFPASPTTSPSRVAQAMLIPPPTPYPSSQLNMERQLPPVLLVLHGAGVDFSSKAMTDAVPRLPGYWAVVPEGGNEWGEDWHGGSMAEVWAARNAVNGLLAARGVEVSDQTVLMGHSNGGQGAWHLAARYPDKIVGLIAAAGYLSIQHYVPYTALTSIHFADPSLMGILDSALTPYQNDLYASNLTDIPILAIHGADDDNVPPRHSRAHLAAIAAWAGSSDNLTLIEVPAKGHWWDDILQSDQVVDFISGLKARTSWDQQRRKGFTIGTANPQESGGRAGIRIVELETPGRLARLDVNARQWKGSDPATPLDLRGTNVKRIEVGPTSSGDSTGPQILVRDKGQWQLSPRPILRPRAYGPMIRLLSTSAPVIIIIPSSTISPDPDHDQHLSLAKRLAYDLYAYHRLDTEIISDREGLERLAREELGEGNVVVLGRPEENRYADWMMRQKRIPLSFPTKGVMLLNDDQVIYDRGAGIISLHPHPTSDTALSVLIAGNDALGLELAARLFPIRTGVPIPDWAIVSPRSRWQAAGGLIGAGFWDGDWGWSETMSWTDR